MEVIRVSGSLDSFDFVYVDIPDDMSDRMPQDPHAGGSTKLLCFAKDDVDIVKKRFGCKHVVPARSKQGFEDILYRSNRILFESRYGDRKAPHKPNKHLLNALNSILRIAADRGRNMLILMQVTESQYAWMESEISRRIKEETGPAAADRVDFTGPAMANAWHTWIPSQEELEEESPFAFKPEKVRYSSPYVEQDSWGSLFVHSVEKVNRWIGQDTECRCLLCRPGVDEQGRETVASLLSFHGQGYVMYRNPDGAVDNQLTVVRLRDSLDDVEDGKWSSSLSAEDVQLMRQLVCSGLDRVEQCDIQKGSMRAEWEGIRRSQFTLYLHMDTAAKKPRHMAMHCVPMHSIPLPRWREVPWEISGLGDVEGYIARAAGLPFYAILITPTDKRHIDCVLERLHARLRMEKQEYCILITPRTTRRRGKYEPVVAIIPLHHEHNDVVKDYQGLEFLTGVCILGPDENPNIMNPAVRDNRLRAGTFTHDSEILKFERMLRDLFGNPSPGLAAVATDSGDHYSLTVEANTTLEGVYDQAWKSYLSSDSTGGNERSDTEASPLLIRITRAGISNADRRHLGKQRRGHRDADVAQNALVVCREGGGYIVDPGGYADAGFSSGMKVVLTPYHPCGTCDACRSFKPNLCSSLKLMGFDYHGCLRQMAALRPTSILPVTSALHDDALPLVEPLACCMHALFRVKDYMSHLPRLSGMEDPTLHPVSIYGAGPIGMLVAYAVRRFWPTVSVLLIDPQRQRRQHVERLDRSGLKAMHSMPDGHRSSLTIVTANSLEAYQSATKTIETGGIVIVYAGLNRGELDHDDRNRSGEATFYQNIHQNEDVHISGITVRKNYTLIGSSGYIIHDLRRAIHELTDHYNGYYSDLQTITINGLGMHEALDRRTMRRYPFPRRAVNVYLTPEGIRNEESERAIGDALKVLIRI